MMVVQAVVGGGGDDVGMILGGVGWRVDDDGFGVAVVEVVRRYGGGGCGVGTKGRGMAVRVIVNPDIVTGVLQSFPWKELSKEMGSKIPTCGDGSCWKTFKPIASLIAKGKLK
nr:hypothetical protein [Tanacetum cinerariifolium]